MSEYILLLFGNGGQEVMGVALPHGSVARKPLTLIECHLFTFELCNNKVIADGFDTLSVESDLLGAMPARC